MISGSQLSPEKKNIEILTKCLKVAKNTEDIAAITCNELYNQDHQLDRITNNSIQISTNLDKSKTIVKGMSGFMGRVKN